METTMAATEQIAEFDRSGSVAEEVEIALDPNRPGVERARLVEAGVAVWALIGYMGGENGDIARTAADYGISEAEVRAALAYYRAHRTEIDALLARQRAAAS
jgi:uncharacterized protein (DUF433 family)